MTRGNYGKILGMYGMAAAMSAFAMAAGNYGHYAPGGNGRGGHLEGAPPKNPPVLKPKGYKTFLINGIEIEATTRKTAEKKYIKQHGQFIQGRTFGK